MTTIDMNTTKGSGAMLATLDEQHRLARGKLHQIEKRREALALDGALGDAKAIEELRILADDEERVSQSLKNIEAARRVAIEKNAEAARRERVAHLNEIYDDAERCRLEVLDTTSEIVELTDRLVEVLTRRKAAAQRWYGLRVADEIPHYAVTGQGVYDHLAAVGFRDLVQGFNHSSANRLDERDPTVLRNPSREIFLRSKGVEQ